VSRRTRAAAAVRLSTSIEDAFEVVALKGFHTQPSPLASAASCGVPAQGSAHRTRLLGPDQRTVSVRVF
jgi:hypothetical protein